MKKELSSPGLYCWYSKGTGQPILDYVGKSYKKNGTGSVWHRIVEHYTQQISLTYDIPKEYRADGNSWSMSSKSLLPRNVLNKEFVLQVISDAFDYTKDSAFWVSIQHQNVNSLEQSIIYDLQPRFNRTHKNIKSDNYIETTHCGLGY